MFSHKSGAAEENEEGMEWLSEIYISFSIGNMPIKIFITNMWPCQICLCYLLSQLYNFSYSILSEIIALE